VEKQLVKTRRETAQHPPAPSGQPPLQGGQEAIRPHLNANWYNFIITIKTKEQEKKSLARPLQIHHASNLAQNGSGTEQRPQKTSLL